MTWLFICAVALAIFSMPHGMNWLIVYAQVFAWLSVSLVFADFLKSLRTILLEGLFVLISLGWIILSPLTAFFGVCFPDKLLGFLRWSGRS